MCQCYHEWEDDGCVNLYHEWEGDGCVFDLLDDPEQHQTHQLDDGKDVNSPQRYVTQVGVVWLVLGRDQEQHDTVHQLEYCTTGKMENVRNCF